MDAFSLGERAKALETKRKVKAEGEQGIGLRLDLLAKVTEELNADPELKAIFGEPVMSKLAVFSNGKDISIIDAGAKKLTEDEKLRFLRRLKETYNRTLTEMGGG